MLIVFMSQPDFACNCHALWKYIKQNTDYETAWIIKKIEYYQILQERGIKCAVYDTVEANEIISRADILIANSYTFLNINKREDQLLVNLWHGSGVKAHDYYDHNLNPRHMIKLKNYFDKVDLMCVHSLDDRFKLAAMLNFDLRKVYVTGQARLDCVVKSDGKIILKKIFGEKILQYDHLIFFAPSYRSNMSCHAGKIFSDNIFRLDDFDNNVLDEFLKKHNAAIIYKLHPIEQTAFAGRNFNMSEHCYEMTDSILFEQDVRYDEILNSFDVMVSDYSSIVYDYLLLNRPIVYLLPDFEEYKNSKGFVFNNISLYMPGEKAYDFENLLKALAEAFVNPDKYADLRNNVIMNRFDYTDDRSAERCFKQIMGFTKLRDEYIPYQSDIRTVMPTVAEQIEGYVDNDKYFIIDSRKTYENRKQVIDKIERAQRVYYITSEIPSKFRSVSVRNSYKIVDMELYNEVKNNPKVNIAYIMGGVDYNKFCTKSKMVKNGKKRIGFAGTIDNRIYFSMVQCICEEFSDCEVVFAGTIVGDYPAWLGGFDNLTYTETEYDKLPEIISTFDVAILPFFGGHKKTVPVELFQYLAGGKSVVASDMPNLPECEAIFISKSTSEAIEHIKQILAGNLSEKNEECAKAVALKYDWKEIAKELIQGKYNYFFEE